jgi:DNA invertase Pin-like site-specific DNA recombinase
MLKRRGPFRAATLKAMEQPIDTSMAAGKCFLDKLGVFAEFETNLRRERQLEGIVRAKAVGVYKGGPASIRFNGALADQRMVPTTERTSGPRTSDRELGAIPYPAPCEILRL